MGTSCYIGKVLEDGTVKASYCHYDGYPQHVGRLLTEVYNTPEKIDELLAMGDMSSLGETLETCRFYARDMGEDDAQPTTCSCVIDFRMTAMSSRVDFRYLYKDGAWT